MELILLPGLRMLRTARNSLEGAGHSQDYKNFLKYLKYLKPL